MKNKSLVTCTVLCMFITSTMGTNIKDAAKQKDEKKLSIPTEQALEPIIDITLGKTSTAFPSKNKQKKRISFDYENEDLANVINYIAAQMGINIILPQGPNAIKTKLSLSFNKKIRLKEAWDLLQTLLDIAGYSIGPNGDMFIVIKKL